MGGGGSAGKSDYPQYMKDLHQIWLDEIDAKFSDQWLYNPYLTGSSPPSTRVSPYDPATQLTAMATALSTYLGIVAAITPADGWATNYAAVKVLAPGITPTDVSFTPITLGTTALTLDDGAVVTIASPALTLQSTVKTIPDHTLTIDDETLDIDDELLDVPADMLSFTDYDIAAIITAYEQTLTNKLDINVLPAFRYGMQNVNSVMTSAFVIGEAIIRGLNTDNIAKYAAELNRSLQQDKNQFNLDKERVITDRFQLKIGIRQLHLATNQVRVELENVTTAREQLRVTIEQIKTEQDNAKVNYEQIKTGRYQSQISYEQLKVARNQVLIAEEQLAIARDNAKVAYEQVIAAQKQTLLSQEIMKTDYDIRRTTVLIQGTDAKNNAAFTKVQIDLSKADQYRAYTQLAIEANRLHIVAASEEIERQIEFNVAALKWDTDIYISGANMLAAISGSAIQTGGAGASKKASALGGAISGAAAGAYIGASYGSAVPGYGTAIGAVAGAVIGGVGGYLTG